jgi:hypothetical protein
MALGRRLLQGVTEMTGKRTLWQKLYLADCLDPFFNAVTSVRAFYECVKRFFFWGWKLRKSYDFDSHTIYEMLNLKYRRIEKALENGHCLHPISHQRRLKTIIELTHRLQESDYLSVQIDLIESKGHKFSEGFKLTTEGRLAAKKAGELEVRDKKLLWDLIQKYNDVFWD